jgi:hypothetical protein
MLAATLRKTETSTIVARFGFSFLAAVLKSRVQSFPEGMPSAEV